MPDDGHVIEIIHAGAAKMAIRHRKSRRLDNMRLDIETGAEPENRPRILRNVGLEESYAHGHQA